MVLVPAVFTKYDIEINTGGEKPETEKLEFYIVLYSAYPVTEWTNANPEFFQREIKKGYKFTHKDFDKVKLELKNINVDGTDPFELKLKWESNNEGTDYTFSLKVGVNDLDRTNNERQYTKKH